jgi:predicted ABC-type transport system involved in lysophospholipase L1 biosynthesis ATPase subunit
VSELAIAARGVRKAFEAGRIVALRGMDLEVARGELVALVGPSGCGKSTLLHLLAALDVPDGGSIVVDGHDLARERDLGHYRARHVGLVFQLHNLLPSPTASENVQVPMFELGLRPRERRGRAARGSRRSGSRGAPAAGRPGSPGASASASRSRERSPTSRRSCSRTSPPEASTPPRAGRCSS